MKEILAKTIIGKDNNINLYRGCTHGCIYCDSRSLCYQIKDFTDINVKINAIQLLQKELSRKRKKTVIVSGSMSDPYLPIEKELQMTRQSLELIYKYGFGACLLTKSDMVLRDLDLFKKIDSTAQMVVEMTITTADDNLCKIIEPNVSVTSQRFAALKVLQENCITTGIWLGPILPFINDDVDNLLYILEECRNVGVNHIVLFEFGMTLREGNREYFYYNLDKFFPGLKSQYFKTFGMNYKCLSPNYKKLKKVFEQKCQEYGIVYQLQDVIKITRTLKQKQYTQLTLF